MEDNLNDTIESFSHGMKQKVALIAALAHEPKVLIMDEPTNFLDSIHIEWLTKYLKEFKGAFLVVSHDEGFLNDIGEVVWNLNNKNLTRYNMDYRFVFRFFYSIL